VVLKEGEAFASNERQPAMWGIESKGKGKIIATHQVTRKVFEGTTAEFNARLRG